MSRLKENTSISMRKTYLRPREKAATFGITNLTTTELLALIIGSGTVKQSVYALAEKLTPLIESGQFLRDQAHSKTLGAALFWRLQAVCELSHRLTSSVPTIRHATDVWHVCGYLGRKKQEYVVALYLDGRQKLIEKRILVIGGTNFALLEPTLLLYPALTLPAASCILVHNHPSGSAEPSQDDILVTHKLTAACNLVGIELLDHIVIGADAYTSLKELGHMAIETTL